jgi:hypothetical protein
LQGFSDHVLITTQLEIPSVISKQKANEDAHKPSTVYKWAEGTSVKNYAQSAQTWAEFTDKPEFFEEFRKLVEN